MKLNIITFISIIIIWGCAGKETSEVDTVPPLKPHLIQHLGDTGDEIARTDTSYYNNPYYPEIEFNGIDAISDDDETIQIQLQTPDDVTDINSITLFRFSLEDYQNASEHEDYTTEVKTLTIPSLNIFYDEFDNLVNPFGKNWFYFIKAFDIAGNSTKSDTVCYKLLTTTVPLAPEPDANFQNLSDITFSWQEPGPEIYRLRILLFDSNHNLLWSEETLDIIDDENTLEYSGAEFDSLNTFIWRIDSFGQPPSTEFVNDQPFIIYSGSESQELYLFRE